MTTPPDRHAASKRRVVRAVVEGLPQDERTLPTVRDMVAVVDFVFYLSPWQWAKLFAVVWVLKGLDLLGDLFGVKEAC